ncbi:hypothetical protein KKH18_04965 [bacterium]|nr:hypothetical protein [bacterium]
MKSTSQFDLQPSDLLAHLDIAAKFRNHEFNIQFTRNVVFTGSQAVMLACYAATITGFPWSSLVLAVIGIFFASLGYRYYRAGLYWARFWENRCRQVYDSVANELKFDVNIFEGHPSGQAEFVSRPVIKYAGKSVSWGSVHNLISYTQILFLVMWIFLAGVAGEACRRDIEMGGAQRSAPTEFKSKCEVLSCD